MPCLLCGGTIPLVRRLADSPFCSDEHGREHANQQGSATLARLHQWKSSSRSFALAEFASHPEPEIQEQRRNLSSATIPIFIFGAVKFSPQPWTKQRSAMRLRGASDVV